MAKPWARLQQNYINHPKFLALTANAICLWLEGKNYCDMHATDGMIPREALKTFRFAGAKSIEALMRSCGLKPNGDAYAPLWESHLVGYKMHDYLDHNDCHDAVKQRIEDAEDAAELRRLANKERQQKFRVERKAKLHDARNADRNALRNGYVTPVTQTPTETSTQTQTQTSKEQGERTPPPTLDGRSRQLAYRGQRVKVFMWQFEALCGLLGPHADGFDLDLWFQTLDRRCLHDGLVPPDRDGGAWLKAETLTEAQRRGLPLAVASAPGEADMWAEISRKGPSVRA